MTRNKKSFVRASGMALAQKSPVIFLIYACTASIDHAGATPLSSWMSDVTLHAQGEGGIMANPARPADGRNFGQFFGDHANQAQLDQIAVTIARAVDTTAEHLDVGFLVCGLYGADARYFGIAGVADTMLSTRYQVIVPQAHIDVHMPWLLAHGMDMQAGILSSPMGVEALDPSARPFYTLSYTTQYSTPFEHIGAMFQAHVAEHYDFLFGVDTGNQVSFGKNDNNGAAAGYFGLTGTGLAGGRLTLTYLGRIGPEDAVRSIGKQANTAMRFWNDANATYKIAKNLSGTIELNFLHDDGLHASTYSAVTYLAYNLTPTLTLNYRGELYRDNSGLFVTSFLGNNAYLRSTLGKPAATASAPPTTYGALTVGASWRPVLPGVTLLQIRPEIRFDRSLNGTSPFDNQRDGGRIIFGGDVTLSF